MTFSCSTSNQKIIAGIDVGGTFTDLIIISKDRVKVVKTPTTEKNQAFGVLNALEQTKVPLASIGAIVHGTTTTTNAVLERKFSKTGMITTKGFKDIIESKKSKLNSVSQVFVEFMLSITFIKGKLPNPFA